jgi:hypothetical protein
VSLVRVSAYSATHSATHVATGMLRGLKQIILGTGLSPTRLADDWTTLERGVSTWLKSGHLLTLSLEIWDPSNAGTLIERFDFDIDYGYSGDGEGELWLDPRTVQQAILKAGAVPSKCDYRVVIDNADGRPYVEGFKDTEYLSTNGLVRRSVGTAVAGGSLGAVLSYWQRKS